MKPESAVLTAQNHFDLQVDSPKLGAILKIEETIAYMLLHLNEPLRVATLAARAELSKSHFTALFKRYVGSTPIDYFIRLRLRQACRLLESTGMSVKTVAYTLGYDDPFYFSRIFKAFVRISPSEYRLREHKTEVKCPPVPRPAPQLQVYACGNAP